MGERNEVGNAEIEILGAPRDDVDVAIDLRLIRSKLVSHVRVQHLSGSGFVISRLEKSRTKGTKLVSLRARLLSGSGFVSEGLLKLFSIKIWWITNKILYTVLQ